MFNNKRLRIPRLLSSVLVLLACSIFSKPNPAVTPDTSLAKTPVSTPVPAISSILAPVARGDGISEAAQYIYGGPGPHRLVVLTDSGSPHEWNEQLPTNWIPSSVNETELVVIVFPEQEVEIDTHKYVGGPPITRYRFETHVEVREARSGFTLWEGTLQGSMPIPFPEKAPVEQTRLSGTKVSFENFEDWLSCKYIVPRECEYRKLEGHTNVVLALSFSPDGQTLASGSSEVRLWRISDGAHLQTLDVPGGSVNFSNDGQILASVSGDGVHLWRVSDSTLMQTLKLGKWTSVAFSPDGEILASSYFGENNVRLWRISDGTVLRTLDGHTEGVVSVAFSPDGQTLASGSRDLTVRLWQVSDGTLLQELFGHKYALTSVTFSPDGQTLASGSSDLTARIWRVSDGALLQEFCCHPNVVSSVSFSPDGRTLATGSSDGVRLWRVSDGILLRTLKVSNVTSVAFSPDGQILASGSWDDNIVHLWWIE